MVMINIYIPVVHNNIVVYDRNIYINYIATQRDGFDKANGYGLLLRIFVSGQLRRVTRKSFWQVMQDTLTCPSVQQYS